MTVKAKYIITNAGKSFEFTNQPVPVLNKSNGDSLFLGTKTIRGKVRLNDRDFLASIKESEFDAQLTFKDEIFKGKALMNNSESFTLKVAQRFVKVKVKTKSKQSRAVAYWRNA